MRVLIFSLAYYPLVGGAEIAIKEITDRIDNIEFDMVTLRFNKTDAEFERIGNVNVYRLDTSKNLFPFRAYFFARRLHHRKPYDAIWAMMANWAGFAAVFFKYGYPNMRYILTLQEGDSLDYIKRKVRFVWLLFVAVFRKADTIQSISNYLANWAEEMGYKKKVEVIPNGVDTLLFTQAYDVEQLNELKKSLGGLPYDRYLITTSRLVEKNGVGDVIDALKYLPENVKFLVLGTGPLERALKDRARANKVEARVKFLGFVEHKEMPKYLKISDIFIRPSLSEGMGNSFIEAMVAGVPVIATPVGGIPDFLFDPDKDHDIPATGLFVNVHDPKSIATQVSRLLTDSDLRNKLIENGKKLALEKYDWTHIAEGMKKRVFKPSF